MGWFGSRSCSCKEEDDSSDVVCDNCNPLQETPRYVIVDFSDEQLWESGGPEDLRGGGITNWDCTKCGMFHNSSFILDNRIELGFGGLVDECEWEYFDDEYCLSDRDSQFFTFSLTAGVSMLGAWNVGVRFVRKNVFGNTSQDFYQWTLNYTEVNPPSSFPRDCFTGPLTLEFNYLNFVSAQTGPFRGFHRTHPCKNIGEPDTLWRFFDDFWLDNIDFPQNLELSF